MTQAGQVEVHVLSGAAGCRWARERKAVAVVVDALRASATITLLLHRGAEEVIVVKEVSDAYAYRQTHPQTLLVGERGGLKVDGFDFGNSPTEIAGADIHGQHVTFTSTTGAQRLVDCLGAAAVVVGTTINATAVARHVVPFAQSASVPIVVIPAGLATDPDVVAEEDWLGAAVLAAHIGMPVNPGSNSPFQHFQRMLRSPGLLEGFLHSTHGQHLVHLGFAKDVQLCAQIDLITDTVPVLRGVASLPSGAQGVRLRRGNMAHATPL